MDSKKIIKARQRVGQKIKASREKAQFTQTELAALLKVHRSTVAKWESGETKPRQELAGKIEKHLGLDYIKDILTLKLS